MFQENVSQPDSGATSISVLITSGFSFNFSATATNYLLFFSIDSNSNDGESGKPAAAASKSLTISSLFSLQGFSLLATSSGDRVPVLSF